MSQPLISLLMTTYNHEKYIGEAVASVLGQTFGDFEAVIIDDGSTDRTGDIIRSFGDRRIRYLHQPNQGPSVATTTALAACQGKYLALMSGDDVLQPNRFSIQVEAYKRGPTRLLFAGVDFIDDDGRPLGDQYYSEVDREINPGRARLLERMFFSWPSFFGVTAFTERQVMVECGPDDPALFQTQDYARWIQLVKRYDFEILPDRVYKFRIRTGGENLSSQMPDKQIRAATERYLVMKSFFDNVPMELFREAFRRHLTNANFSTEVEKRCEQAFLLLRSSWPLSQLIGIERLHELLHDPQASAVLKDAYQFDYLRFAETLKTMDITKMFERQSSAVWVDEGQGWKIENVVRQPITTRQQQFHVVFDLQRFSSPKTIAWAPIDEPRLGQVKIEKFTYRDTRGVAHNIPAKALSCHACTRKGDYHVFETSEPRLFFSPAGAVQQLEVVGKLELLGVRESIAQLTAALTAKQAIIDRLSR